MPLTLSCVLVDGGFAMYLCLVCSVFTKRIKIKIFPTTAFITTYFLFQLLFMMRRHAGHQCTYSGMIHVCFVRLLTSTINQLIEVIAIISIVACQLGCGIPVCMQCRIGVFAIECTTYGWQQNTNALSRNQSSVLFIYFHFRSLEVTSSQTRTRHNIIVRPHCVLAAFAVIIVYVNKID